MVGVLDLGGGEGAGSAGGEARASVMWRQVSPGLVIRQEERKVASSTGAVSGAAGAGILSP